MDRGARWATVHGVTRVRDDLAAKQQQPAKAANWSTSCITHRSELKWIRDLKLRSEIMKLLEENIGSKLFDVGLSNNFLDMSPKAKGT